MKIDPLSVTFDTDRLKQLIAEHPDYPIMVLAGEEANDGEHSFVCCTDVRIEIADILDAETPIDDEYLITDESYFEEQMEEWLWNELGQNDANAKKMPEEEFQAKLHAVIAEFDPYWRKVIAIYANN